ncbi:MAG: DUF4202 family protein [Desulfomonile tiedjei]|uniref:DUF4202 family protein n=1 Tax=Desulfomonile tiedjei TaxID=2358 RepID=A0A9D6V357_9BACT|nr:DUF4202 family protein [Desulfomonile tiedjei]
MDESIQCVNDRVRSIIAGSRVPEDPAHAENTVKWLHKLDPNADDALSIAAFGHDIDRAVENRRIRKADFQNFDAFKAAHARNSSEILYEIMLECGVHDQLAGEVRRLVMLHEAGGDVRSDLLKNADSLSFFEVNLPFYYTRNGWEKTLQRSLWGYGRLSLEAKGYLPALSYSQEILNRLLREVIRLGQ